MRHDGKQAERQRRSLLKIKAKIKIFSEMWISKKSVSLSDKFFDEIFQQNQNKSKKEDGIEVAVGN